jgi:ABC-type lipoprotein release transport system permease subunit
VSGFLFGVTPTDVPTFAAVIGLLVGTCVLASYLPARRAARVGPILSIKAG